MNEIQTQDTVATRRLVARPVSVTEVVNQIVAAKSAGIKAAKYELAERVKRKMDATLADLQGSKAVRDRAAQVVKLRRELRDAEKKLAALSCRVQDGGSIELTWEFRSKAERAATSTTTRQERLDQLRRLKGVAMTELLDLDRPTAVRDCIRKFQAQVDAL